jgi:hypothetical protein
MMMMTMATISAMTNHPSTISTLLMKVMTPFLILPTTIITSMTTCHQISFAKMKRWIPHLKGKVDMTKKPIPPPPVTPTDALPVTMVTSNIPTVARTSVAQKAKKKICPTSLILKTACHNKKLWLVPVEAISAPGSYGVRPPWNPQQ